MRFIATFALALLAACGGSSNDGADQMSSAIVGGGAESGYAAAGYLVRGSDSAHLAGLRCGAVLVAPQVALTAGHCVAPHPGETFGVGFGRNNSGPIVVATRAVAHPDYDVDAVSRRFLHDVAVLILERAAPVQPAQIAGPSAGGAGRLVGYGRVTDGDYDVTTGYTGERKSTGIKITRLSTLVFYGQGVGGGLCWGDSGGPVLRDGSNDVLGVLSDFDQVQDCHTGNGMVFTSLVGEAAFINGVTQAAGFGSIVTP